MATKKFSALPAAAALDGSEALAVTQGGASVKTTMDDLAAYAGGWTKVVDQDGTSLTGWVNNGGTWAASTHIEQSDTGTSERIAVYAPDGTPYLTGACVIEADIQIPTASFSNPDALVGIGLRRPNASGPGGMFVCLGRASSSPSMQFFSFGIGGFAAVATPPTLVADTWATLRVVFAGAAADIYLNGSLVGVGGYNAQYETGCLALYTYRGGQFRNIKGWKSEPVLPA